MLLQTADFLEPCFKCVMNAFTAFCFNHAVFLCSAAFPTLFSSHLVLHEVVGNYSHLFWVPGSDLSLVPYMLLAHIDVVPANESDGWDAPPFSAKEIDGFIYGRGTIDNKQSVMVRRLKLFLVYVLVFLGFFVVVLQS